jgi:hypothetical protein
MQEIEHQYTGLACISIIPLVGQLSLLADELTKMSLSPLVGKIWHK